MIKTAKIIKKWDNVRSETYYQLQFCGGGSFSATTLERIFDIMKANNISKIEYVEEV